MMVEWFEVVAGWVLLALPTVSVIAASSLLVWVARRMYRELQEMLR